MRNKGAFLALVAIAITVTLCSWGRDGAKIGVASASEHPQDLTPSPPGDATIRRTAPQGGEADATVPEAPPLSLADPAVLEEVRRLYAENADAWHAEWLQAEADKGTGTRWLSRVLDRFVRLGGSRGPFAMDADDFSALDQQQMATLGDYLHHGVGWLERAEGTRLGVSDALAEKAFQALREQPLSFDPMQALALLGADPVRLPLDSPEYRELAEARKRLLVLAAPSLTFLDESEHFAYDAMTMAGIPIEEAIREDVTLVVPDIRVHRQILADLEQEYFDLLLQTASDLVTAEADE